jgi:hypothetical protein
VCSLRPLRKGIGSSNGVDQGISGRAVRGR